MNWIEIEDNAIMLAGHEVEIDVRAAGAYEPPHNAVYEGFIKIEPESDASFEVHAVEFRTSKQDPVTKLWVPTSEWKPFPVELLFPSHMDAIAEACVTYHQDKDQRAREDAAEARRAA